MSLSSLFIFKMGLGKFAGLASKAAGLAGKAVGLVGKVAPYVSAATGAWNAFKQTKIGSGISNKIGNWVQNVFTKPEKDDSGFTKFMKGVGDTVNEALFDPTTPRMVAESVRDKYDPVNQQVSRNSSNATTNGADGSIYGEPAAQKKHYDYIRNDFENLLRNKLPPEIGRSHKYNPQEYVAKTMNKIRAEKYAGKPGLMKRFRAWGNW